MEWSEKQIDNFYSMVGGNIKEARVRKRVTQSDLGNELGLTRSSIANVEAGRQRAQLHNIVQIATALQVSIEWLVPTPDNGQNISMDVPDAPGQPDTTADFLAAVVRRAESE